MHIHTTCADLSCNHIFSVTSFLKCFFKLKSAPLPPTNLQSAFKSMGASLLIVGALLQVCGRFITCPPQGTPWQYQMCNLALLMFYMYSQSFPDSCPTSTYAVFLHANYLFQGALWTCLFKSFFLSANRKHTRLLSENLYYKASMYAKDSESL